MTLSLCLPYTLQHAHDRHTQRHHHTRTQKAETHKDLMSGGLSGEHERAETQAQMHKMQQDLEGAYHKANRMEDELDAARMQLDAARMDLKEQTHLRTVAEAQAATAMEQSDILDVALQKVALPLPAATLTCLSFWFRSWRMPCNSDETRACHCASCKPWCLHAGASTGQGKVLMEESNTHSTHTTDGGITRRIGVAGQGSDAHSPTPDAGVLHAAWQHNVPSFFGG